MRALQKVQVHHQVSCCLLRLRDAADAHQVLDGAALQAWLDYECEALEHGVDPDITREDLAALVDDFAVAMPANEHRDRHAEDFRRWGRRGGLATLRLYGPAWFALLARRRWERVGADALASYLDAAAEGGRS